MKIQISVSAEKARLIRVYERDLSINTLQEQEISKKIPFLSSDRDYSDIELDELSKLFEDYDDRIRQIGEASKNLYDALASDFIAELKVIYDKAGKRL